MRTFADGELRRMDIAEHMPKDVQGAVAHDVAGDHHACAELRHSLGAHPGGRPAVQLGLSNPRARHRRGAFGIALVLGSSEQSNLLYSLTLMVRARAPDRLC